MNESLMISCSNISKCMNESFRNMGSNQLTSVWELNEYFPFLHSIFECFLGSLFIVGPLCVEVVFEAVWFYDPILQDIDLLIRVYYYTKPIYGRRIVFMIVM